MPLPSATFFADPPFTVGTHTALGEDDVRHLRVLRMSVGDRVGLRDGAGHIASGQLVRLGKTQALVEIDETTTVDPPLPIHLLVPVADRDRMLWLAEKAAEFNITTWRPVLWRRSKSVSPRGEGQTFRTKVRARMISAMLQSKSAWLPEIFPESPPDRALTAVPGSNDGDTTPTHAVRIALEMSGTPIWHPGTPPLHPPVTLAIGPEGGFEPIELEQLTTSHFTLHTLGPSILRFETAAVAAIAIARCMLTPTPRMSDPT
jgi:16S rRNA (uracil1498-N3)-methyltransferase